MIRYEQSPPTSDGAAYQSWLRRRIAKLETQQAARVELTVQKKKEMDDAIERAELEIRNLRAQQTMGVVK